MNIRSLALTTLLLLAPGLAYADVKISIGGKTVTIKTGTPVLLEDIVSQCGENPDKTFKAIIKNAKVLADFFAEWCGPCKKLAVTLQDVAKEYADKDVVFLKIDVDKFDSIAEQQHVSSMPTLKFFDHSERDLSGGKAIGAQSKKILKDLIAQYLKV